MTRIALDATLWDAPITGIGLYTHQLHRALTQLTPIERWGASKSGDLPRGRQGRTLWTLTSLPRALTREHPEVFHAVSNFNLPLKRSPGTRFVLTVHDLVPLILPDTVSRAFRWQFHAWIARSLEVADQVICVSETTRRSVLERFSVAPEKLTTVLHGVDHVHQVPTPDDTSIAWLNALGLPSHFVLYAGALDARKNVELVLKACERIHEQHQAVTLVLAGQRWFGAGSIEKEILRLKDRGLDIRTLGYLADSVFYALMKHAGVFVFPSRYEGFGLPPLEAMALGVPTIVSTEGSLPEVTGDGALQVAPDDAEGLAGQILSLRNDPVKRSALIARGLSRAAQLTWAETARRTLGIYRGEP